MLMWQTAITDRSQSDVERVLELLEKGWQNFSDDEKAEWNKDMKGALNMSDLLRIQNNVSLLKDVLELDMEVFMLGKNMIPYPYYHTTRTQDGITFTDNGDGTVTVGAGTATAQTDFQFKHISTTDQSGGIFVEDGVVYTLSGCPKGGSGTSFCIHTNYIKNSGWYNYGRDYGNGLTFTGNGRKATFLIRIFKGAVIKEPITFKPMLVPHNSVSVYEPYLGRNPYVQTEEVYAKILENVETIRSAYCIHSTTPKTPTAPLSTFQKWNDIERILTDVHEILLNNFHYYCGSEIYAGDDTGLLL